MDVHGRTVAAQDFFFVDPHRCSGKFNPGYRIVRGKQQHASPGPRQCQRIDHNGRVSHRYQNRIGASPLRPGFDVVHKLTITRVKRLQCP